MRGESSVPLLLLAHLPPSPPFTYAPPPEMRSYVRVLGVCLDREPGISSHGCFSLCPFGVLLRLYLFGPLCVHEMCVCARSTRASYCEHGMFTVYNVLHK